VQAVDNSPDCSLNGCVREQRNRGRETMAEEKKKSLKITRASDVTKEKIAEVNKILAEIESGKAKPMVFSLHIRI
jgi:hypothetical protein